MYYLLHFSLFLWMTGCLALPSAIGGEITVDGAVRFQTMEGFGLSLADHVEKTASTNSVWQALYARDFGFSVLKIELSNKGLAGTTKDEEPPAFSTSREENQKFFSTIPEIKAQADLARGLKELTLDPLKVIATSRTAPYWLKTGAWRGHRGRLSCGGILKNDQQSLNQFALYLASYEVAWERASGMGILSLGIQREPRFQLDEESMEIAAEDFPNAIIAVGDTFAKWKLPTKIHAPEDVGVGAQDNTWPLTAQLDYIRQIRKKTEAFKYIGAWATHGFAGAKMADDGGIYRAGWAKYWDAIQKDGKKVWVTEASLGSGVWDGERGPLFVAESIHEAITSGQASLWVGWMPEQTPDKEQKEVGLRALRMRFPKAMPDELEFASSLLGARLAGLAHFSRFIRPGGVRVAAVSDAATGTVQVSAYYHPRQGGISIVLINPSSEEKVMNLKFKNLPIYSSMRLYLSSAVPEQNFTRMPDIKLSDCMGEVHLPPRCVATLTSLE